ncbi:MAG: hypothetical protein KGJ13_03910 [Patescibacteria group bacterium]|nr:hypothetical protein [Patescibacteria group bacterium]
MRFLERAERWLRRKLQNHPLLYALVGGVGVVLFWRGVWHMTDFLALTLLSSRDAVTSIDWAQGIDSLLSFAFGTFLLLSTGLFISELLSGEVLLGKIKKEETTAEETEETVEKESSEIPRIEREVRHIAREVQQLEKDVRRRP